MKKLSFIIAVSILSIELFAQVPNDSAYSESEIVLKTSTGDLSGSLVIPNHPKSSPVVLIIAGSGPTDRNCNNKGLQTNAYKMIAEDLAKNGISSLRFDKRGIGKSRLAMANESEIRFETFIKDAADWISLLKKDKRFSSIYILGHSEGSLIGMIVAEQTKVNGFISVSGAGKSADKLIQEQLKTKLSTQLVEESDKILDSLKTGKTASNVNPLLFALYRPSVQPYLISWIKYDPSKEIGKLKMPVLIIQGTTDLQITVNDAKLLSASKPDAKLILIDNMNHVLKECESDVQKNMATYVNPGLPLKAGLTAEIIDFIKAKK